MLVHRACQIKKLFSTVNKDEMAVFQKLTNWWHPAGPMQILYSYNYHRINFLKKHIKADAENFRNPLKDMKALDVGCGAGFLCESMTRLGACVTGLDPNITSFNEAVSHKSTKQNLENLQYINMSI